MLQNIYKLILFIFLYQTNIIADIDKKLPFIEHKNFDDILLIINYNHPHYNSIPFLKKIYSYFFPNIVFYGPIKSQQVEELVSYRGWFSYKAISHAMQKYPNYKGYLLLQDDCFINSWNFLRFNKDKIWIVKVNEWFFFSSIQGSRWWQKPCGFLAYKKVLNDITENNQYIFNKNLNGKKYIQTFSDVVYIPNKYMQDTIKLFTLCEKYELFLEIAIPTVCFCLDYKNNIEIIKGIALWREDRKDPTKFYNKFIDFIHPLKFERHPYLKEYILKQYDDLLFSEQVY